MRGHEPPSRPPDCATTNDRDRPKTAIHWSHSQWPFADQKAAVRITLLKPPVLSLTGHWRSLQTLRICLLVHQSRLENAAGDLGEGRIDVGLYLGIGEMIATV